MRVQWEMRAVSLTGELESEDRPSLAPKKPRI